MIVRIKYVTFHENEKIESLVVWALSTYPVEQEDYDIEMSLFVPLKLDERDLETQVVFEKDSFFVLVAKLFLGFMEMIVSSSTHVSIFNKIVELNKCPLKVSLVGISQELPCEVKDDYVIKTLVFDFSGQEYNFIMKVVFSYYNLRLTRVKDTIRPQELLIFVVGQLEIIKNEFYIYAKDINYVDTRFSSKKKFFDRDISCNSSLSKSSIRSKLLVTHKNIVGDSEEKLDDGIQGGSNNFVDSSDFNFAGCSSSVKRARVEEYDESSYEYFMNVKNESCLNSDDFFSGCVQEGGEESGKNSKSKKNASLSKDKEPVVRSLHSNSSVR
ncbi:28402_t:CDS:2 [Dentiscutata erythropus]|uniref:28402_t:CDS:1 n=1 Tax=Dentiscutata erythropus TaxID=1348616 RepID=A0A9N9GN68_9GLOM|nr:28402_t:CDS:2 [Dentiscutata erythropus]